MADQKNLSPEEKLLNVIQGKEKPDAKAAGAKGPAEKPTPTAPAAPTPAVTQPAAGSAKAAPKLQMAPQPNPQPSQPRPAPAPAPAVQAAKSPASGQVPGFAPETAPKSVPPAARADLKLPGGNRLDVRSRTLATVNRLLRVVVLAMVGLCAWEIWVNCTTATVQDTGSIAGGAMSSAPAAAGEPCSAFLAEFEGKPLFRPLVAEVTEPTVTNIEHKTAISEVQQYVTRNLNLIGTSPGKDGRIVEAILTDIQTRRNYFLKVGDKITMKNWAIELKQVEADRAVFACGKEEIHVQ